jgi:hypothetical protein
VRTIIYVMVAMGLLVVPAVSSPAATVEVRGVKIELRLDKAAYRMGEAVEIILTLTNSSGSAVEVQFPTGQMYDFVVTRDGRLVWQWSLGRVFTQALTTLIVKPGESRIFTNRWDQRDTHGQQVPSSLYEMVAVFPVMNAGFTPQPESPRVHFSVMDPQ